MTTTHLQFPLTLRMKLMAVAPQFFVVDANEKPVAYIKQKLFKLKEAINVFEKSEKISRIFPKELIANLVMTKRQELHYMAELTPSEQTEIYLDSV